MRAQNYVYYMHFLVLNGSEQKLAKILPVVCRFIGYWERGIFMSIYRYLESF